MAARQQDAASRTTPDGRTTRWAAHRARRREQLIDAALEVLEEHGPDFGMNQVAARAGVTKPVVYRHFGDRMGLVDAMGDRATNLLMSRLMPALFADDAPLVRIRSMLEAFLGFVAESPNVYWFFARRTPEGRDVVGADKSFVADALRSVLAEYLRTVDPAADQIAAVWARGAVGFVLNTAEWWLESREVAREDVVSHLTTLLWAQVDGMARHYGVELDPQRPISVDEIERNRRSGRGA
ncbi:transcriptional regulator, TetR family [Pseudonocardia thermophila]|uniref:Transcriptional regulator, TetR family n=1 Tax=Pseudonocardia thermophila TaxID=1848 RepID=A0A1M6YNH4_PSETH|nr:TetR family transcriptional regulator [Pseudonocardia thermophila]SHL19653.1 transcriptional regulator, TetR family [Pseudonocardia thermophila]